jgi:4-aminobutyrate aminotransferase
MQPQYPEVGEVRGLGLMMAVDLVKDREAQILDPALRDEVVQLAFHKGLLLLGCGESAIRFCPPLCVSAAQVETALRILGEVLAERRALKKTG